MTIESPAAGLHDLAREFRARGWYRKTPARVLLELLAHLSINLAGVSLLFAWGGWAGSAVGLLLLAYGTTGVATNTHTSSHYGTSNRKWLNEALTYFGYPFFLGFSACYWWHSHVAVHHPSPNVIGVDDFADVSPFFARTRADVARARNRAARFYYQHLQWLALLVLLAGQSLHMQAIGWNYLLRRLADSRRRTRAEWIDLSCLVSHALCFIVLPALLFGWVNALEVYLLRGVAVGYLLFAILAPGHFPAEAACLDEHPGPGNFLEHMTAVTVNFRTGPLGRLLCGGIEYHLEHHLFPAVSHVYYPEMSGRVREFCEARGLRYRSVSWPEAIWNSVATFRRPPEITSASELRLRSRGY